MDNCTCNTDRAITCRVHPHRDTYPNADHLTKWVQLREAARVNGQSGDPNIDNWRYCNVRRQDDKVTKFVREWLEPWEDHPMLIPNTVMARLFNNPATLEAIGFQEQWDPMWIKDCTDEIKSYGNTVFNAAYIVSTNGRKMDKVEYLCTEVLPEAFRRNVNLGYAELEDTWRQLTSINGIGSFMGAQVVADLKYTRPFEKAADWWTFVAPGPGSMRGMNRLRGLDAKAQKYNEKAFSMYIQPVRGIIKACTGIDLCAQDTQNTLCELDKYMRLVTGEGRPKQKYTRS